MEPFYYLMVLGLMVIMVWSAYFLGGLGHYLETLKREQEEGDE